MSKKQGSSVASKGCFRLVRGLVKLFYPKVTIEGLEHLPKDGAIIVGNHTQMNGPICGELYFPGKCKTWCAYQMMYLKEVPPYAYQDFWSGKPGYIRWFYKLLSYVIAPIAVAVFNNAKTIPVYHDARIISTFRDTLKELQEDTKVIIFPECYEHYNHILYRFQDKFVDVAKLYYKKTGKALQFVPLYIAPKLHKMYLGKSVAFCPENPIEEERKRICEYLMKEITDMAVKLPEHIVVPYANISKREYNTNKVGVNIDEKADL